MTLPYQNDGYCHHNTMSYNNQNTPSGYPTGPTPHGPPTFGNASAVYYRPSAHGGQTPMSWDNHIHPMQNFGPGPGEYSPSNGYHDFGLPTPVQGSVVAHPIVVDSPRQHASMHSPAVQVGGITADLFRPSPQGNAMLSNAHPGQTPGAGNKRAFSESGLDDNQPPAKHSRGPNLSPPALAAAHRFPADDYLSPPVTATPSPRAQVLPTPQQNQPAPVNSPQGPTPGWSKPKIGRPSKADEAKAKLLRAYNQASPAPTASFTLPVAPALPFSQSQAPQTPPSDASQTPPKKARGRPKGSVNKNGKKADKNKLEIDDDFDWYKYHKLLKDPDNWLGHEIHRQRLSRNSAHHNRLDSGRYECLHDPKREWKCCVHGLSPAPLNKTEMAEGIDPNSQKKAWATLEKAIDKKIQDITANRKQILDSAEEHAEHKGASKYHKKWIALMKERLETDGVLPYPGPGLAAQESDHQPTEAELRREAEQEYCSMLEPHLAALDALDTETPAHQQPDVQPYTPQPLAHQPTEAWQIADPRPPEEYRSMILQAFVAEPPANQQPGVQPSAYEPTEEPQRSIEEVERIARERLEAYLAPEPPANQQPSANPPTDAADTGHESDSDDEFLARNEEEEEEEELDFEFGNNLDFLAQEWGI